MPSLFFRIVTKIVNKFYDAGVFNVLINKSTKHVFHNVEVGEKCDIDSSALLLNKNGGKIILRGENRIGRNTELQPSKNGEIKIGYGTSIQDRNIILGDVEFGRYCLTAPNVYISSGRHYFNHNPNYYIKDQDAMVHSSTELSKQHSKKVIIEDDVWIGINSVIMPGITIGRGTVIGANSVVTNNVEPFSIMIGAPAKLIKKRLELTAKTNIDFNNDNDLPNFYSGFFINTKNLFLDRSIGGISATNCFKVYMHQQGSIIELKIKNIGSETQTLLYNNQEILITGSEFQRIGFKLNNSVHYHEFKLKASINSDSENKYFLVKQIEIIA